MISYSRYMYEVYVFCHVDCGTTAATNGLPARATPLTSRSCSPVSTYRVPYTLDLRAEHPSSHWYPTGNDHSCDDVVVVIIMLWMLQESWVLLLYLCSCAGVLVYWYKEYAFRVYACVEIRPPYHDPSYIHRYFLCSLPVTAVL